MSHTLQVARSELIVVAKSRATIQTTFAGILVVVAAVSGCSEASVESSDAPDRRTIAAAEADSPQPNADASGHSARQESTPSKTPVPDLPLGRDVRAGVAANVVVALNGGATELFRGVPVIAEVAVFAPNHVDRLGPEGKPFSLSAKAGDWSSVIRWEVHNEDGQTQDWPFQLSPPASPTHTASAAGPMVLKATLSAEDTRQITAARYRVAVVIDPAILSGLEGTTVLHCEPVSVEFREEPPELNPTQQSGKLQVRAMFWWLRGNPQKAFAEVDEYLKREPNDVAVLALKSELLAEAGDIEAAFEACGLAIDAHLKKYGTKGHPPAALLIRQRDLLNALLDKDAAEPVPDAAGSNAKPIVADSKAKPLSDADLLTLLRLEIGDKAILEKIRKDGVRVQFDEGLRKRLREAGATEAVLAAIESAANQSRTGKSMTFEDVQALLRLEISSDAILKRIQESSGRPTLTPEQREELQKAGASAKLLEYLDDRSQEK